MNECQQRDTTIQPTSEVYNKVLGKWLGEMYTKLRRQFEADNPELFQDERGLSRA